MYKYGILNSEISKVLSDLGHTDLIAIADCGLPVPDGVKKIDLALKLGEPSFLDVYQTVLHHMVVEKAIIAEEMVDQNSTLYREISNDIQEIEQMSHEAFKQKTKDVKAIIRTGEATPYANVILQSGVLF